MSRKTRNTNVFIDGEPENVSDLVKIFTKKAKRVHNIFDDSDKDENNSNEKSYGLRLVSLNGMQPRQAKAKENLHQSADKSPIVSKNALKMLSPVPIVSARADQISDSTSPFKSLSQKQPRHNKSLRRSLFSQPAIPTKNSNENIVCSTPFTNNSRKQNEFFLSSGKTFDSFSPISKETSSPVITEENVQGIQPIQPEKENQQQPVPVNTLQNLERDLRQQFNINQTTPVKSYSKSVITERTPKSALNKSSSRRSTRSEPAGKSIANAKDCSVRLQPMEICNETISFYRKTQLGRLSKADQTNINTFNMIETPIINQPKKSVINDSLLAKKLALCDGDSDMTDDESLPKNLPPKSQKKVPTVQQHLTDDESQEIAKNTKKTKTASQKPAKPTTTSVDNKKTSKSAAAAQKQPEKKKVAKKNPASKPLKKTQIVEDMSKSSEILEAVGLTARESDEDETPVKLEKLDQLVVFRNSSNRTETIQNESDSEDESMQPEEETNAESSDEDTTQVSVAEKETTLDNEESHDVSLPSASETAIDSEEASDDSEESDAEDETEKEATEASQIETSQSQDSNNSESVQVKDSKRMPPPRITEVTSNLSANSVVSLDVVKSFRTLQKLPNDTTTHNSLRVQFPKGRSKKAVNSNAEKVKAYVELEKNVKKTGKKKVTTSKKKRTLYSDVSYTQQELEVNLRLEKSQESQFEVEMVYHSDDSDTEIRQAVNDVRRSLDERSSASSDTFGALSPKKTPKKNEKPIAIKKAIATKEKPKRALRQRNVQVDDKNTRKPASNKRKRLNNSKDVENGPPKKTSRQMALNSDSGNESVQTVDESFQSENDENVRYDPYKKGCVRPGLRKRRYMRPYWIHSGEDLFISYGTFTRKDAKAELLKKKYHIKDNELRRHKVNALLAPSANLQEIKRIGRKKEAVIKRSKKENEKEQMETASVGSFNSAVTAKTHASRMNRLFDNFNNLGNDTNVENVHFSCPEFDMTEIRKLQWIEVDNGVFYSGFKDGAFDGLIRIEGNCQKRSSKTKHSVVKLTLLCGGLSVQINSQTVTINNLGSVTITKGQKYSIRNPLQETSILLVTRLDSSDFRST